MLRIFVATATAILAIGCSSASNSANNTTNTPANDQLSNVNSKFSSTNTVTVAAPAVPESQYSNTATSSGAKTFIAGPQIVGKDIEPGTYRTRTGTENCSWTRKAGFTGTPADILAAGKPQGPAIVTIKASDKGFESSGCGMWTSDLSAITTGPGEPFGDGEFIVGTDIAAGTWKAVSTPECYWARLKSFSGDATDIIANSNGSGIVTILKTDKGFVTSGCGSWSRAQP